MCSASKYKFGIQKLNFLYISLSLALCCLGPHSAILLQVSGSVGKNRRCRKAGRATTPPLKTRWWQYSFDLYVSLNVS